mmetsp:Transcript_69669/g.157515  ORF Transcript_69669/g.157515 Transcript_69669/m.157515 type:complete len:274 (+) Transcript_69669:1520-2341(+)
MKGPVHRSPVSSVAMPPALPPQVHQAKQGALPPRAGLRRFGLRLVRGLPAPGLRVHKGRLRRRLPQAGLQPRRPRQGGRRGGLRLRGGPLQPGCHLAVARGGEDREAALRPRLPLSVRLRRLGLHARPLPPRLRLLLRHRLLHRHCGSVPPERRPDRAALRVGGHGHGRRPSPRLGLVLGRPRGVRAARGRRLLRRRESPHGRPHRHRHRDQRRHGVHSAGDGKRHSGQVGRRLDRRAPHLPRAHGEEGAPVPRLPPPHRGAATVLCRRAGDD